MGMTPEERERRLWFAEKMAPEVTWMALREAYDALDAAEARIEEK